MDLEALRAKKPADLSDDEKKFVEEHKDELTAEERKSFDVQTDEDKAAEAQAEAAAKAKEEEEADAAKANEEAGKQVEASRKAVSISADRLAKLEADAAAGLKAAQELAETKAKGFIAAAVSKGQIKTGDSGKWTKVLLASSASQRADLETLITGLPVNEELGKEHGDAGGEDQSAETDLVERASKMASESSGKVSYSAATKSILASDKDLRERLNAERSNQTKKS